MIRPGKIVIIGAGPTGLGAAYRLQELGTASYVVLEATTRPGGLAASYIDPQGFTWDVGGHVQFSHYRYYDAVLDRCVTGGWLEHERDASVWLRGRWIPYPFQNNIHRLPSPEREQALADLEQRATAPSSQPPANFKEWIEHSFGPTIANVFLFPYNEKVWGYPLSTLDTVWMGERVAPVDVARVRRNVAENTDDVAWGPNSTFRFPRHGGTGAIWEGVARSLPVSNVRYGATVQTIDVEAKCVSLTSGDQIEYDHLISTMPLDVLCRTCVNLHEATVQASTALRHSSVHVLGIGLKGDRPEALRRKCWMYFPEAKSPYYRVTVFTNYSPFNAPPGNGLWSLMAEVCESSHKPVDRSRLEEWTISALREDGLIGAATEVVSYWHHREECGYPTPFLGRDQVLDAILPELERKNIYSRGRFGAWKYEVSNQDHSFMQGVEVVDRLLGSGDEPTLRRPHFVNSGVFTR